MSSGGHGHSALRCRAGGIIAAAAAATALLVAPAHAASIGSVQSTSSADQYAPFIPGSVNGGSSIPPRLAREIAAAGGPDAALLARLAAQAPTRAATTSIAPSASVTDALSDEGSSLLLLLLTALAALAVGVLVGRRMVLGTAVRAAADDR